MKLIILSNFQIVWAKFKRVILRKKTYRIWTFLGLICVDLIDTSNGRKHAPKLFVHQKLQLNLLN